MTTAYQLRPWTEVVRPHPDVASGDLAMGTYAANLARVAYRGEDSAAVYADPAEFFASTYFTETCAPCSLTCSAHSPVGRATGCSSFVPRSAAARPTPCSLSFICRPRERRR